MRLGYQLRPQLLLQCVCRVCRQAIDSPVGSLREDQIVQRLVGWRRYAVCPCCGHTAPDEGRGRNYRARFNRFVKRRENKHVDDGAKSNIAGGDTGG